MFSGLGKMVSFSFNKIDWLGKYQRWIVLALGSLAVVLIILANVYGKQPITAVAVFFFVSSLCAYTVWQDFFKPVDFIGLLLCFAIVAPPLDISTSLPDIRLDELIIYIGLSSWLAFNAQSFSKSFLSFTVNKMFIFFFILALTSWLYSIFFLNLSSGIKDFFEYLKFFKFVLLGWFVLEFIEWNDENIDRLVIWMCITSIGAIFLAVGFFYNFAGMTSSIAPIYIDRQMVRIHERFIGPTKNPNEFAQVMLVAIMAGLTGLLRFTNPKKRAIAGLTFTLGIYALIMSGSRTGLAVCIFVLLCFFGLILWFHPKQLSKKKLGQIILIGVIVGFISSLFLPSETSGRLQTGITVLEDDSMLMRFAVWYFNLKLWLMSPLLGWGPAKYHHSLIVDSEYVLILRRYGLLGLLAYLGLLYAMISHFLKIRRHYFSLATYYLFSFFICLSLIMSIFGLTATSFQGSQTFHLWLILFFPGMGYLAHKSR